MCSESLRECFNSFWEEDRAHRGSQRHLSTENSVLKIHVTLYARCDLSK